MPSLGTDMVSGILTEWLVKPGQTVRRGDIVAVVETDKGAIEIEIFEDARIVELLVTPDTEVAVGAPLARLEKSAGAAQQARAQKAALQPEPTPPPSDTPAAQAAPAPSRPPSPQPTVVATAKQSKAPPAERRKVSPAARKHAREHDIDLDTVPATGHGGVVTVADIERMVAGPAPSAKAAPQTTPKPTQPARSPAPVATPMRRAIADAMSRSKREIPHYYLAHTIDVEAALTWLDQRNRERPIDERVLPGILLLKAAAVAVSAAPAMNGFWRDDGFVAAAGVDVGVVIALRDGGLAAPTLTDVANRRVDDLMAALRDATQRARRGRLKSSEVGAASITVSSLGDSPVDTVYPIIHPPQVAIVGFGGIVARPWVVDNGLFVRRVVVATLAADHRASDGAQGARYLTALARALQQPETL